MAHDRSSTTIDDHTAGGEARPVGLMVHTEVCPLGKLRTTAIGELDAATGRRLADHLAALPLQCDTLDLRFVSFIDASGFRVVQAAVGRGVQRVVASARVERLLHLCGLDDVVDTNPTTVAGHLHCADFAVAIYDHDRRYVYVNDALATLHGLPAQVHIGYHSAELLGLEGNGIDDILRRVTTSGQAERRIIGAEIDGRPDAFDCYFGPADARGEPGAIMAVVPLRLDHVPFPIEFTFGHLRSPRPVDDTHAGGVRLTAREQQVLDAIADGCTNSQIAAQLFLSVDTVKTYCRRIYAKLGVENRTQAAVAEHQRRA